MLLQILLPTPMSLAYIRCNQIILFLSQKSPHNTIEIRPLFKSLVRPIADL